MRGKPRWIAAVALTVLLLEASSYLALLLLRGVYRIGFAPISLTSIPQEHRAALEDLFAGRPTYMTYSSTLGWTIKPNGFSPPYRANSRGLRATREYSFTPPPGVVRISSFGDSFTHSDDVPNDAAWQEALMRLDKNLEVLNFGVSGFGLDQAFLRYQQDGMMYGSHIILIGFLSESIFRSVNVYRPFYVPESRMPLAKPRYLLDGEKLILLKNPMPELSDYRALLANPEPVLRRLAAHDYYVRARYDRGAFDFLPSVRLLKVARSRLAERQLGILQNGSYDTASEAFRVTMRVLDLFVATASSHGAVPIVVLFPRRADLAQYRRNRIARNTVLVEHFRRKGYRYIDVLEDFDAYGSGKTLDDLIHSHYTPTGNEIVARSIWNYLVANRLVNLKTVRRQ